MSTTGPSPAFAASVEAAVRRVEERSSAEIVVVLAGRSDDYREVPWIIGGVAGWAALGFAVWSPWTFSDVALPVDALVVGGIAGFLARGRPALARWLVPAARRQARVQAAAEASFVQEAVHGTRQRTGVLVYWSRLEGLAVVIADQGVLGRVTGADQARLRIEGAGEAALLAGLDALGEVLARHLPADGPNPNEIPDAPRIRP